MTTASLPEIRLHPVKKELAERINRMPDVRVDQFKLISTVSAYIDAVNDYLAGERKSDFIAEEWVVPGKASGVFRLSADEHARTWRYRAELYNGTRCEGVIDGIDSAEALAYLLCSRNAFIQGAKEA